MKNNKVVSFQDALAYAKTCDVTPEDILQGRDLEVANLIWSNPSIEADSQVKLIKHERALEQYKQAA